LSACDPTIEYVPVRVDVPPELLRPVPVSDRQARTYRDLAVLATEHRAGLEKANTQIEALAEILGPQ
jgi:hypothetical protein